MAHPEVAGDYPRDLREMIVYEALLRIWGRVVLDSDQLDPFMLARTLAQGHEIPEGRMLDLNWAAYSDIIAISGLEAYTARHMVMT